METTKVESAHWNIFTAPVEDDSTTEFEYTEYRESNINVQSLDKYEFFTRDLDAWLLPHKSYLIVKGKLLKEDGTNFTEAENVALVNNGFSIFRRANYFINDQLVESIDFVSVATTILGLVEFSDDYTRSVATQMFWYRDTGNGSANKQKYIATVRTNEDKMTAVTVNDNPDYNLGFAIRHALCSGGKTVTMLLPLSHLFGFCKDIRKSFRGLKHTVKFDKNYHANMVHASGDIKAKFQINFMSWWVPILKPNLMTLARLEAELAAGDSVKLFWESISVYRSDARNDQHPRWRVATSANKPSHIFVVMQQINREGNSAFNSGIFDHMNLERAQVRINSVQFPKEEFEADFTDTANDYQRIFHSFLEAGMKLLDVDTGSQVNYLDLKNLYPILHFDVSHQEDNLYATSTTADIEVRLQLRTQPATAYYIYCIILSERFATLQGVENKTQFIL
jgi:hypothetical protein